MMKRKFAKDSSAVSKKVKEQNKLNGEKGEIEESSDKFTELLGSLKSNKQILRAVLQINKEDENKKADKLAIEKEKEEIKANADESEDNEDEDEEELVESEEEYTDNDYNDDDDQEMENIIDPFRVHFEKDLPEDIAASLIKPGKHYEKKSKKKNDYLIEEYTCQESVQRKLHEHLTELNSSSKKIFQEAVVKENIVKNWEEIHRKKLKKGDSFSTLQVELLNVIASYKDLFFFNENHDNIEDIRKLYTLHAVNHVLKTRTRIVKNNARLDQAEKQNKTQDDCQDQGLTRPKVLILAPFKNSCLRIVQHLMKLVFKQGTKGQIMQKKRFLKEFSQDEAETVSKANRPDDFNATFEGNIDDCFRFGVSLSKNTIKLFTPFYASDIIIASPLGLRTIIGTKGEKQDFDFLSSIEVMIVDQADIFLMQNWEHVTHIFDHLHKLPKESHDTDFSRVRMWCVNQWSKLYRQTLLFSSVQTPELNSILNKYCHNYNGKVKQTLAEINGSVEQIVQQTPQEKGTSQDVDVKNQVYQCLPCQSYAQLSDERFNYFINKVLPDFKGQMSSNTAIFIPSYFDFVRVRNHFKKEELSFAQISEYSKRSNISRARNLFLEKRKHFLLFTERFYFFYRYRIRGIKHIIFYELPQYPQFYSEIINFLDSSSEKVSKSASCTVLYHRFDGFKLEAIVGTTRCKQITLNKTLNAAVAAVYTKNKMYCEGLHIVSAIQTSLSEHEESMIFFSHLVDPRYTFLILFPFTYCLNGTLGLKVLWTTAINEWLNAMLKWLVRDDRPYWYQSSACSVHSNDLKQFPITCETGPGFPSGHVMSISALGMLLLLHAKSYFRSPKHQVIFLLSTLPSLALLIVLVSISRVFIATHFPHQVIMGALVGVTLAVIINGVFNSYPVEAVFSPFAGVVGVFALLAGLFLYYTLEFFYIDPLATVAMAMKYCAEREWIHLDTTLFFAIIRDAGCLTGLGLASFLLDYLIGPKARTTLFDTKLPPSFRILCGLIVCPVILFMESFRIPQEKVLKFYIIAFLKFAMLPCYVMTMKWSFEIFCKWVFSKKCKLK